MKTFFISMLPVILLCGVLTTDAAAQNSVASQPSSGFIGWDTSKPKSSDVAVTAIIQEVVSLILESTQSGSIEGLTVNPYQARAGVKMHWLALALLVLGKRAKNIDRQRQCRSSATCTTCSCPSRLSTVF